MYKIGFCPQCHIQIMTQDTNGRWNGYKPNFRQADLNFENGPRVRTIICEECLGNPNLDKIMESIVHCESQACSGNNLERVKSLGIPSSITLAAKARQGVRLGV